MIRISVVTAIALSLAISAFSGCRTVRVHRVSTAAILDSIQGGWAGQMIGVSYGAPTEFRAQGKVIEGELAWSPDRISNAIDQDDLYVEMTFAEVMDKEGLDAPAERYGEAFRDSKYGLWHANAAARRLLNLGVKPPESGRPERNIHANDIDFQIEADFIGLMCPGLPQASNRFCERVGRVMNSGDGLYGGMFVAGMYATAFFEFDPRKVVEGGLACIPRGSGYAAVIRDVLDFHAKDPEDWRKCWGAIGEKWDRDDPCPDGALAPFNIDARLNGAYIAIGLLYGKGDFGKTLEISTRCGQDSDCNPASAGGILGVMTGWTRIPDEYKSGIERIADTKFRFTNYSLREIVRSTFDRAAKVIAAEGGMVLGTEACVPFQDPKAPRLEMWDPGVPDRAIPASDPAWRWTGPWVKEKDLQAAGGAGAEAVLTFEGTGVAVVGPLSRDGGRADVELDGKKILGIDAFCPENTNDNDVWHVFGLVPGLHTMRIALRDDADPRATGKRIAIEKAIVFKSR